LRFVQNHNERVAFTRSINLIDKIGPRTAERILEAGNNVASNKNVKLLTALLDKLVLKKVPEVARDDYQDLILTLQDMSEALHGKEIQTGATAAELSHKISETPEDENSLGELFDFFADGNEYANSVLTEDDTAKAENIVLASPAEVVRIGIDGWYGDFLKKIYPNWQQRYDDLESLIGFAEKFENLSDLLAQLALFSSETTDKDMRERNVGNDSLRLSTIHQAKGLEFPIVFVIGCADGLFPLRRAIEEGDLDEERRLFYVACTRAKEKLFMLYPKISSGRDSSLLDVSQFIREADPSSYRMLYGSPRSF
ncbi:MAG: ATP-dependent helicase, partial [Opitutales bacterium]|nr:ATP-dependent helicase [Opitutales bacterium]